MQRTETVTNYARIILMNHFKSLLLLAYSFAFVFILSIVFNFHRSLKQEHALTIFKQIEETLSLRNNRPALTNFDSMAQESFTSIRYVEDGSTDATTLASEKASSKDSLFTRSLVLLVTSDKKTSSPRGHIEFTYSTLKISILAFLSWLFTVVLGHWLFKQYEHRAPKAAELVKSPKATEPAKTYSIPTLVNAIVAEKRLEFQNMPNVHIEALIETTSEASAPINPLEFCRVISNLVNNSVEALPNQTGWVVLEVKDDNGAIAVSVADNGPGIATPLLEKLGSMMTTPDSGELSADHSSSLVKAKRTLNQFGGELSIDTTEGSGTTVKVTLPQRSKETMLIEERPLSII